VFTASELSGYSVSGWWTLTLCKMEKSKFIQFFEDAYRMQCGEYYPETHLKNLAELERSYDNLPKVVIDALYRFAIYLDVVADEKCLLINNGELTLEQIVEELQVTFYYARKSTIVHALESKLP
jgi:predicted ATPase